MKTVMQLRSVTFAWMWTASLAACAADGLVAPAAETLWPHWQARISVQSSSLAPWASTGALTASAPARGLQGAALLGDYYFATPSFGSFRASGGLMTGAYGGSPLLSTSAGPRLGLSVNSGSTLASLSPGYETSGTVPYLGFGFSGGSARAGLAITADLGLVAERTSIAGTAGRGLLGNQGIDNAQRELRLSPVWQLGVRYTF